MAIFAARRSAVAGAARLAASSSSASVQRRALAAAARSPALPSLAASNDRRASLTLNDADVKTLAAAQRASFSSVFAKENASDRETITRLLYSLASRKEVERYLRIFSAANKFAVLKVGGAILTHQLDELALSLSFLHRVSVPRPRS